MIQKVIEKILFTGSKALLIPFYFGLVICLALYCYVDLKEIWHLMIHTTDITEVDIMMSLLRFVDMTMIANLVKMIITGSYTSFVSKKHNEDTEKTSSGLLKVKMSTSIIGVSSIHMLQTFINASGTSYDVIYKQMMLHGAFLIGALIVAYINYLHDKTNAH